MKKSLNWLFDYSNLKVYQFDEGFKFSLDSLLLAEFAEIKKNDEQIIDFCSGNGVIPIVLNYKYHKKIIGVEIQKEICQLAEESAEENHMEKDITFLCDNVINLKNYYPEAFFDVILCNPPYFKYEPSSYINQNVSKSIARHEIEINLSQIMMMASYLLKDKGRMYFVHLPARLEEIILFSHQYGLTVKEMQLIQSKTSKDPAIVLLTFVKNGRFGMKVYAPKVIENLKTYQNIFERGKRK